MYNIEIQWIVNSLIESESKNRLSYCTCPFLCTASPGWEMPLSLAELLSEQDLMIGKGDANYRRLVGDLHWPYETPLNQVLE